MKGHEEIFELTDEDLSSSTIKYVSNFPFDTNIPSQRISSSTNSNIETPTDKIIRLRYELSELEAYLDKEDYTDKEYLASTWKVLSKESLPSQFHFRIDEENTSKDLYRHENEWYISIEERLTRLENLIGDFIPSSFSSLQGNLSLQPLDKLLLEIENQVHLITPNQVDLLKKRIASLYTELETLYTRTSSVKDKDSSQNNMLKSLEIAQDVEELMTRSSLIHSWTNSLPLLEENLKKINQEIHSTNENNLNLKNLNQNYDQLLSLKESLNNNKILLSEIKSEIKMNFEQFQTQISMINNFMDKK